jgi:tetrapyrrole methylase family protein/MazG family protein
VRHCAALQEGDDATVAASEWDELLGLIRRLRAPDGCPWDRAQTHRSLRKYALEEAREVCQAVDSEDMDALAEELGDLLLQVVLHAAIAEEEGAFGPDDVVRRLAAKLVRRHPHVFGDRAAATPDEVAALWATTKAAERAEAGAGAGPRPFLDEVPRDLPALAEAQELGRRAAQVGFDWGDAAAAWPKVAEESRELEAAMAAGDLGAAEDELGDVLFAVVNTARLLGLDAELALYRTNAKFRRRFAAIEDAARNAGRDLNGLGLDAMEAAWQAAKQPARQDGEASS